MIIFYILAAAAIVIAAIWLASNVEDPVARAGRRGEEVAEDIIRSVLHEDDTLLTNIELSYDGNRTEIDNIVINRNGVFLIEVKNYVGDLEGDIDDYNWKKYKVTPGGEIYVKIVKNPIQQVKRQIYIVSSVLKAKRIKVWIEGYVILLHNNSPVDDSMVLRNRREIDLALHQRRNQILSKDDVKMIKRVLDR